MQNEIVNKIAEWLQISAEKAIELYPQLRTEAVWYSVTISFLYILGVVLALSLGATFIAWMEWKDCEEEQCEKRFKNSLKLSIVIGLLISFLVTVPPFLFPNIVFFKQFVK